MKKILRSCGICSEGFVNRDCKEHRDEYNAVMLMFGKSTIKTPKEKRL